MCGWVNGYMCEDRYGEDIVGKHFLVTTMMMLLTCCLLGASHCERRLEMS